MLEHTNIVKFLYFYKTYQYKNKFFDSHYSLKDAQFFYFCILLLHMHISMKINNVSNLYLLQEIWNSLHKKQHKFFVSVATNIASKEHHKE